MKNMKDPTPKTKKLDKSKKLSLPIKKMSAREKDYIGALMENYNGNLTAIFEVLGDLRDKYDMHTEMIGNLMVDVSEIKGEIVEIKGHLKRIDTRLDRIEQTIKEMKDEIKELKSTLKNKADVERVELLETRLYRVEERLTLPA